MLQLSNAEDSLIIEYSEPKIPEFSIPPKHLNLTTTLNICTNLPSDYVVVAHRVDNEDYYFTFCGRVVARGYYGICSPSSRPLNKINSVAADALNSMFYLLSFDTVWQINDKLEVLGSFPHQDNSKYPNSITLLNDRLIIPHRTDKCLIVYKTAGERVRSIPVPQLVNSTTYLCPVGTDSVIISQYSPQRVFRVNIETGQTLWTYSKSSSRGVAYHAKSNTLLVSSSRAVLALDADTGSFHLLINMYER